METLHALYRVCLIGPECTGKTTIAARLAERYRTVWVPEYAREYAERVARPLTSEDAEPIARGQLASEDRLASAASGMLILDTDLLSTYVYARHYYGAAPDWLESAVPSRLANHYILFSPDCPFTPDAARDPFADRLAIHNAMSLTLDSLGARYTRVGGGWEERWEGAVRAVDGHGSWDAMVRDRRSMMVTTGMSEPPSLQGLSLSASLTVKDLEKSLTFYRDVMGFSVDRKHEREGKLVAVSLKAGDVAILIAQDNGAKGWDRVKGEGFSLRITTDQDLDQMAARIKTFGIVLDTEPMTMPWGARVFRVRDPDGFIFAISSEPPAQQS